MNILAIAIKYWTESLRSSSTLILWFLVLCLFGLMPIIFSADATLLSRLRLMIAYSWYMNLGLCCAFAIFSSIQTMSSEIAGGHFELLHQTSLQRYELYLGKWLGVFVSCALLSSLACGLSLWSIHKLYTPNEDIEFSPKDDPAQILEIQEKSYFPGLVPSPGFYKTAEEEFLKLKEREALEPNETIKSFTFRAYKRYLEIAYSPQPGKYMRWELSGLEKFKRSEKPIYLHLKLSTGLDQVTDGTYVPCDLILEDPTRLNIKRTYNLKIKGGELISQELPKELISKTGRVRVMFRHHFLRKLNLHREALYVSQVNSSFTKNYLQSFLIILISIGVVISFCLMVSSILPFSTSLICAILFLLLFSCGDLIRELVVPPHELQNAQVVADMSTYERVRIFIFHFFVSLIPAVGDYSPIPAMLNGSRIAFSTIVQATIWLGGCYGGLFVIFGCWILHRRDFSASSR